MAASESKHRARIAILNHICQFSLARDIGGQPFAGLYDMRFQEDRAARPGSLIALQSAPRSKWYLSWLHQLDVQEFGTRYLLESIEDGQLCWWENVSVLAYNSNQVREHPEWRWSDRQFAFNDRWLRSAKDDGYLYRPMNAIFEPSGTSVRLEVRRRWESTTNGMELPDWRKATKAVLRDIYLTIASRLKEAA